MKTFIPKQNYWLGVLWEKSIQEKMIVSISASITLKKILRFLLFCWDTLSISTILRLCDFRAWHEYQLSYMLPLAKTNLCLVCVHSFHVLMSGALFSIEMYIRRVILLVLTHTVCSRTLGLNGWQEQFMSGISFLYNRDKVFNNYTLQVFYTNPWYFFYLLTDFHFSY